MYLIKENKNKLVRPDMKMNHYFYQEKGFIKGKNCGNVFPVGSFFEFGNLEFDESLVKTLFDESLFDDVCGLLNFLESISKGIRNDFTDKFGEEFLKDLDDEQVEFLVEEEYSEIVGFVKDVSDLMKYANNKKDNHFLVEIKENFIDGIKEVNKDEANEGDLIFLGLKSKSDTGLNEDVYMFEEISMFDKNISEVVLFTKEKAIDKIFKKMEEKNENK